MRLKSYFAGTVEAAMALAAKELGDEAMLVYSREATPETRYLGRYEVVFALPEAGPAATAPKAEVASPGTASEPKTEPSPVLKHMAEEMAELRAQLEKLTEQWGVPAGATTASGRRSWSSEARHAGEFLRLAGVEGALIAEVLEGLESRLSAPVAEDPRLALHAELRNRLRTDARTGRAAGASALTVLVGPPGAGKTASLVKIAARYLCRTRRLPHLVSFDNYRIGAADQLRNFATLLGVPFHEAETPEVLGATIKALGQADLILVDTAGYGARDMDAAEDLASFLSVQPEVDVHLTLSATTKTADLQRAVERFARFRPSRLLFTRMDEATTIGSVWSEAVRLAMPVSFITDGQQIPEDLMEADADWLTTRLLDGWNALRSLGGGSQIAASAPTPGAPKSGWLGGAFVPLQKPVWTGLPAG